jgi:hypothetical protein
MEEGEGRMEEIEREGRGKGEGGESKREAVREGGKDGGVDGHGRGERGRCGRWKGKRKIWNVGEG